MDSPSKLFGKTVGTDIKKAGETTDRYRFSAAVAASGARGSDSDGYRVDFIRLVQSTR